MIDGEEVLESAQETGYRLCVQGADAKDDFSKVFSCAWDPNNSDRLYICSQHGSLRVYNIASGENKDYGIQFQRFTADAGSQTAAEGRHVMHHWDKMIPIPERPDEMIFLMGVSKSLMYSALPGTEPYPEEPYLSRTTRSDFTGYIYGTPVMELWTHAARVTSIAVSHNGQVLASGDEQGHLKLLMLRLLDRIIPTPTAAKEAIKRKEASKSAAHAPPSFSPFLPEYKCAIRAHQGGPIFSTVFLQIPVLAAPKSYEDSEEEGQGPRKTRYYSLATGSADRAVRLWGVSCSATKGLTITPALVLDTMQTQVLSLSSFLKIDPSPPPSQRKHLKRQNSLGEMVSRTGGGASIMLAAGTHVGAIYVWTLSAADLFGSVHGSGDNSLIDDGTKLHSLLQASDRPIIHLGLSLALDPAVKVQGPHGHSVSLALVASDTVATVRTHREAAAPDQKLSKAFGDHGSKRPITLCGEASFEHAVVSCSMQENPYNAVNPALWKMEAGTWTEDSPELVGVSNLGPSGSRWKGARMLVAQSDGQIQVLEVDAAVYPSSQDDVDTAVAKENEQRDRELASFAEMRDRSNAHANMFDGATGEGGFVYPVSQSQSEGGGDRDRYRDIDKGDKGFGGSTMSVDSLQGQGQDVRFSSPEARSSSNSSRVLHIDTAVEMIPPTAQHSDFNEEEYTNTGNNQNNQNNQNNPHGHFRGKEYADATYTTSYVPTTKPDWNSPVNEEQLAQMRASTSSVNSEEPRQPLLKSALHTHAHPHEHDPNEHVHFSTKAPQITLVPSKEEEKRAYEHQDSAGGLGDFDEYDEYEQYEVENEEAQARGGVFFAEEDSGSYSSNGPTPRKPLGSNVNEDGYNTGDAGKTPKHKSQRASPYNTVRAGATPRPVGGMNPHRAARAFNTKDAGKTPRGAGNKMFPESPPGSEGTARRMFASPDKIEKSSKADKADEADKGSSGSGRPKAGGNTPTNAQINMKATQGKRGVGVRFNGGKGSQNQINEVNEEEEEEFTPPPPPSYPPAGSAYSQPSLNSNQGLQLRHSELFEKVSMALDDDDNISISTINTTDSARKTAARLVGVPLHASLYDQSRLTQILDHDDPKILLTHDGRGSLMYKHRVKKSSDTAFLEKKASLKPTAEDLAPLYTPDPLVDVRLTDVRTIGTSNRGSHAPPTRTEHRERACVGGYNDLHVTFDEKHNVKFTNAPAINSIFGDLDGAGAWVGSGGDKGDEEFYEQCYEQSILGI